MIDKKDTAIIHSLQDDGRKSLSAIGKQLNLSHTGVQKRLHNLKQEGLIDISANINLNKLRFTFLMLTLPGGC